MTMRGPDWRRYNSVQRPEALIRWALSHDVNRDGETGPLFWLLVSQEWSGFDRVNQQAFTWLFDRFRPWWRPPETDSYRDLPRQFQAWRGGSQAGLSWTLNRAVAETFARGHRGIQPEVPFVFGATIRLTDVALAIDDRAEAEVVTFRPVLGLSDKRLDHAA